MKSRAISRVSMARISYVSYFLEIVPTGIIRGWSFHIDIRYLPKVLDAETTEYKGVTILYLKPHMLQ
jgi:hypothetical protein